MQTGHRSAFLGIDETRVTRAVVWNQALWTAGYSLTSGGFLVYFGKELEATVFLIAVLLVVPETAGVFGLAARWIIQRFGSRKSVWIGFSLAARVVSVGIPLLAFEEFRPDGVDPLVLMAIFLAVSQGLQSVAYLSWLSDLVPERHWGRFFAIRNIAKIVVLLVVPVTGGFLRDWWRKDVSVEIALLAYVAAFAIGIALLLVSMIPLLRLPDIAVRSETTRITARAQFRRAFRDRSMRFLLIYSWWLAVANGLTQAAFLGLLFDDKVGLAVGLGTYYLLYNVMRIVKIPVSWVTGGICDRYGNKRPLFWGVLLASCAMPFWLAASPAQWGWVFGAYAMWGFFAAVNISGRNLALTLSPRSDNTAHLALFRQVGGVLAGLSGLLGGIWLDHLRKTGFETVRRSGFPA